MLRDLFVLSIVAAGVLSSARDPFYALLFYLWMAYFRPEQWLWNDWISSLHLSLIVGILILVLTAVFSSAKLRVNSTTWLLALFSLQSFLSAVLSQNLDWSWSWWAEFARVLLIGYLIVVHVRDLRRLRLALLVIAFSLGFEAAKQGWVQLVVNTGALNSNEHPVLGDNNGVAVGMFMLVPILAALAKTASHHWEKWLHRFLAVGVVLRGITTYSRGGFLAAGALCLVYTLQSKKRIRTLVVTCVVATAVLSVMPDRFWSRMQTITAPEEERDASAEGRLHFWQVAVRMAADHPFTGIGFNGFTRSYNAYDTSEGAYGQFRAVHSTWFGALAEMGIPGLALLLAMLVHSFLNCRRALRAAPGGTEGTAAAQFAGALLASFVVYVVGGSFINAQYSEMFWHFACLAGAMRWAVVAIPGTARDVGRGKTAGAINSNPVGAMTTLSCPRKEALVFRPE